MEGYQEHFTGGYLIEKLTSVNSIDNNLSSLDILSSPITPMKNAWCFSYRTF